MPRRGSQLARAVEKDGCQFPFLCQSYEAFNFTVPAKITDSNTFVKETGTQSHKVFCSYSLLRVSSPSPIDSRTAACLGRSDIQFERSLAPKRFSLHEAQPGRSATSNKCIASSNKCLTSSNKDATRGSWPYY